nr:MAG TPA: zinc-ribbon domain protein [Caudoviricetes sp.]
MKPGRPRKTTDKPIPAEGSRLTPIRMIGYTQRNDDRCGIQIWDCRCKCGEIHAVVRTRIENGLCKSCGCLRREMGKAKIEKARAAHVEAAKKRRVENATSK